MRHLSNQCRVHKTVPWAERYSRVMTLMVAFVIKLLEACPTTKSVCALTRVLTVPVRLPKGLLESGA